MPPATSGDGAGGCGDGDGAGTGTGSASPSGDRRPHQRTLDLGVAAMRAFQQPTLRQPLERGAVLEPAIERMVLTALQIVVDHAPPCRTELALRWRILALVARECQARRQQCCDPLPGAQQWIELARPIERHQIVAAADMPAVDEDLRHGGPSAGAADRFLALGRAVRSVDLTERHTLGGQQADGAGAVRAPRLGVDLDRGIRTPSWRQNRAA